MNDHDEAHIWNGYEDEEEPNPIDDPELFSRLDLEASSDRVEDYYNYD